MEPPKKRKYPLDEGVEADNSMDDMYAGDQLDVVSGGVGVVAKRNRRSYSLEFKVSVLDGYYHDPQTRLNQRKTALKYGVNRRQIQKWLAQEETLRGSVGVAMTPHTTSPPGHKTTLSTYLNYQTKINYLRRMEGPNQKVTMVEVTPEFEQEDDFVIDERENYESLPINLSKGDSTTQGMKEDRIVPMIKLEPSQTPHPISPPSSKSVSETSLTPVHCQPYPRETGRYGETLLHRNTPLHHQEVTVHCAQDASMFGNTQDTKLYNNQQDTQTHNNNPQDGKIHVNPQDVKIHMSEQDTSRELQSSGDASIAEVEATHQNEMDVNSRAEKERGGNLQVAEKAASPVSAYILDTSAGTPAIGVRTALFRELQEDTWVKLNERVTDKDGKIQDIISRQEFLTGIYKMKFFTGDYFRSSNRKCCHPYAEVVFEINDCSESHHVSLMLTPYGYSMYRA